MRLIAPRMLFLAIYACDFAHDFLIVIFFFQQFSLKTFQKANEYHGLVELMLVTMHLDKQLENGQLCHCRIHRRNVVHSHHDGKFMDISLKKSNVRLTE